MATRALAKVSSLVAVLTVTTKDPQFKNVPAFAANPAKESLQELQHIQKESQACIKARGMGAQLSFDTKSLSDAYTAASERSALLANMLETARKHAKC